jgi:hypothetical protein
VIRRPRSGVRLLAAASLAGALAGGACRVDPQKFEDRIFTCDINAAHPDQQCGTNVSGDAMKCFGGTQQLGSNAFCTDACDPHQPMTLPDGDICVEGGAKVKFCKPSDEGACGSPDLACMRTDLLSDQGVCLTIKTCTKDTDCTDTIRTSCAGSFLETVYPKAQDLISSDHLYCLQQGCQANSASCSPGEICLRNVIPASANPPDICVPQCDSNENCPPNHFCLPAISGKANPKVCIPGLLGFVCNKTDIDCLIGTCFDDGGSGPGRSDDLHLCTIDCVTDADCMKFDGPQGHFVCNPSQHCVSPDAYRGASCNDSDDCSRDQGSICVRSHESDKQGTCLRQCNSQTDCLPRAGINQTCLAGFYYSPGQGAPVVFPVSACYPGYFGIPCAPDAPDVPSSCIGDLTCRVTGDLNLPTDQPECTQLCATDADCAADRWTTGGWCKTPFCVPPQPTGAACDPMRQMCASGACAKTTCASSPCDPPYTCK